jgi:hypothetical protein
MAEGSMAVANQPETEFIYRIISTATAKSVSLHLKRDWLTGLSFFDYEPMGRYIKFRVSKLRDENFEVVFDENELQTSLPFLGSQPYLNPYDGIQDVFPFGHVTVYHKSQSYWANWHEADKANINTPTISAQLAYFFDLRER